MEAETSTLPGYGAVVVSWDRATTIGQIEDVYTAHFTTDCGNGDAAAMKRSPAEMMKQIEGWLESRVTIWAGDGGDACCAADIANTRAVCSLFTVRSVVDVNAVPWHRLVDALLQMCFPAAAKDIVPLRWTKHSDESRVGTCVTFERDVYPCLEDGRGSQRWWSGLASVTNCKFGGIGGRARRSAVDAGKTMVANLKSEVNHLHGEPLDERALLISAARYIFPGWVAQSDPAGELKVWDHGSHGVVSKLDAHTVIKKAKNPACAVDMQREVAAHTRIRECGGHPAVVYASVIDAKENIVHLECLPLTLAECIAKMKVGMEHKQSLGKLLQIAADVAEGLLFLHTDCGLMHLDLKFDNVMCRADGRAKLIDLSSALFIDAAQAERAALLKRNAFIRTVDSRLSVDSDGDVVRSFGTEVDMAMFGSFLEKLLADIDTETLSSASAVRKLVTNCKSTDPLARPTCAAALRALRDDADGRGLGLDESDNVHHLASVSTICAPELSNAAGSNVTADAARVHLPAPVSVSPVGHAHTNALASASVMTLNVKNLSHLTKDGARRFAALVKFVNQTHPRVLLLQELRSPSVCGELEAALNSDSNTTEREWTVVQPAASSDSKKDFDTVAYSNYKDPARRRLDKLPIEHTTTPKRVEMHGSGTAVEWTRPPVFVKLVIGGSKLLVGSLHLNPTRPTDAQKSNTPAAQVRQLAESLNTLLTEHCNPATIAVIGGDFNLSCADKAFDDLREAGYCETLRAAAFTNAAAKRFKQYDNLWIRVPPAACRGPLHPSQLGVRRVIGYHSLQRFEEQTASWVPAVDIAAEALDEVNSDHVAVEVEHTFYVSTIPPGLDRRETEATMTLPPSV